jgi:hypothetical protein
MNNKNNENMEKLKCKVVMLPTEEAIINGIILDPIEHELHICHEQKFPYMVLKPQHLYLVSEPTKEQRRIGIEEIKEGDYIIYKNKFIDKVTGYDVIGPFGTWDRKYQSFECYKVEATTDPSLNLPLIPQSFVEEYVSKQGKIDEVYIEVEIHYEEDTSKDYIVGRGQPAIRIMNIKTNYDNAVIICSTTESWTREEHIADIKRIIQLYETTYSGGNIDEWIEKNL